ncbi:MAG: DUF881 domain-containing protein [Patescibacteria group bacterium]|nr:DUF881 domain-containing protein [Patescibacteria group bacterium]
MNKKFQIAFIVTGVFVGLILVAQLKTIVPAGGSYPVDVLNSQKELIKTFIDEQALLKSQIVTLRNEIDEAQKKNQQFTQQANLEILDGLKEKIGLSIMRGDGVSILLDDSPFARREDVNAVVTSLVHASDLRDVVNLLRASNVKGIAINDQRIIPTTTITSVGGSILVNNFHVAPPFSIVAIGDGDIVIQQFLSQTALKDLKKRKTGDHIQLEISRKKGVMLPIYNGELRTNYLK